MPFDVQGARKAGWQDAEIADFLARDRGYDLAGARKAGYTDPEVIAHLAGADVVRIPGAPVTPAVAPKQPSMGAKLIGAGEAALTVGTGAVGGTLGMVGGTLKGLAEQILAGQFGTPEAANLVEQSAAAGARALTYEPRTEQGQDMAATVGQALQNVIPVAAVLPGMAGAPGTRPAVGPVPARVTAQAAVEGAARSVAGDASAAAAGAAVERVAALAKSATTLPRRAMERLRPAADDAAPTPGTMGSVGAAGTDMATQRVALAESLPVPLRLTRGQATRDAAQSKFETETAKLPGPGQPLRERFVQQNEQILQNFDHWIDETGAQAPGLRAVGMAVDAALVKQSRADKATVNAAYSQAKRSPEARAVVDQTMPVALGEGDAAITGTPLGYLNAQPTGLPSTAVTDAARQYAVKLGVAELQDGQLVPRQATIRQLEDWRKSINQATGYEPADIRHATILKAMIDGQTEPVAGPIFRQARALRMRQAQNYEDRAVISKLLNNKRGTTDRQVAFEDVFQHAMLKGSLDDVRNVRRVLHRSGETGAQAWRELQGATASWIRDKATASVATDGRGNRVVSASGLDRAIRELDVDGRLDFVFGKKGAQQMRDARELAQIASTVPPEAAVNTSNTASALMAGFIDVGSSSLSGFPVPLATSLRLVRQYVQDAALRRRIEDALGEQARKQAPNGRRNAPPIQEPPTVH